MPDCILGYLIDPHIRSVMPTNASAASVIVQTGAIDQIATYDVGRKGCWESTTSPGRGYLRRMTDRDPMHLTPGLL